MTLNTEQTLDKTAKILKDKFAIKIILINHEKQFSVDTACSNLSLKYNMIYFSAYRVIREKIENKTDWGARLMKTYYKKEVSKELQKYDPNKEAEYSPIHFDQNLCL